MMTSRIRCSIPRQLAIALAALLWLAPESVAQSKQAFLGVQMHILHESANAGGLTVGPSLAMRQSIASALNIEINISVSTDDPARAIPTSIFSIMADLGYQPVSTGHRQRIEPRISLGVAALRFSAGPVDFLRGCRRGDSRAECFGPLNQYVPGWDIAPYVSASSTVWFSRGLGLDFFARVAHPLSIGGAGYDGAETLTPQFGVRIAWRGL